METAGTKSRCDRVKMVKILKVQMLRALVNQRLSLAAAEIFELVETTIAEYEEQLCRSREESERQQRLLDAVLSPQLRLHRADVQQLFVSKEEQQEWSPGLDQEDPEPPHIKEEQEELWSSQEGEQLQGLEEADSTKFPFTPVSVKSEDDEEEAQSLQLHQRQTEQMETGADGEDCGGAEPERDSERCLQPEIEVKTKGSSEAETEDSDVWRENGEHQSGLKHVEKNKNKTAKTDKNSHSCSDCGKIFKQKWVLTRHRRIHTGEKPFSCRLCEKRFTWHEQLKKHKCVDVQASELHQNQSAEKREAQTEAEGEDCGGAVKSPTDKKPKKSHSCSDCGKKFSSKPFLTRHKIIHTEERAFSCSECGKTFTKKWRMNKHMKIHTGGKLVSCSECGKRFRNKKYLKTHMKVHTGDQILSCSECGKRFSQKGHLTQHMRMHTGERPFSCSECGKLFKHKCTLKNHMILHTGERPFSCSNCGKLFKHKCSLKSHMVVHTGEKPFSCRLCEKRFTWHCQLKFHNCVGVQASELHQNQREENREAERGAEGEDCGGAELERDSDQERQLQPETEVKTEDSSEPERGSDQKRRLGPETKVKTEDSSEALTEDSDDD